MPRDICADPSCKTPLRALSRSKFCEPHRQERIRAARTKSRNERYRENHEENVRKIYDASLRRNYGITIEDYERMKEEQGGRCLACGDEETPETNPTGARRFLVVDHDHDTGEVRGLLCFQCNKGLGHFKDDPGRLIAAFLYLERKGLRGRLGAEREG